MASSKNVPEPVRDVFFYAAGMFYFCTPETARSGCFGYPDQQ